MKHRTSLPHHLFSLRNMLTLFVFLFCFGAMNSAKAQDYDTSKTYLVTKNDGTQYHGKILKSDEREILLKTTEIGNIYIPKHEIKSIKEITSSDISTGEYIGDDDFSTRYFLTSNGFPLGRKNNYAQINLWGPDVEFGVGKNFGIGVMTSWLAVPVIATAKYSIELGKKVNFGLGVLAGTLSWANPSGFGVLPYGSLTFGDRKNNISLTGGAVTLGVDGESETTPLMSIAAMARLSKKVTFVFDSFIRPGTNGAETWGLFIPGLRFTSSPGKAFQFGFAGILADGEMFPIPVPMISWLRGF